LVKERRETDQREKKREKGQEKLAPFFFCPFLLGLFFVLSFLWTIGQVAQNPKANFDGGFGLVISRHT